MPSNINVFAKTNASKKETDKRKYKKSNDSDGGNDNDNDNDDGKSCNSHSDTDSSVNANTRKKGSKNKATKNKVNDNYNDNDDEQKFDIQDYRKMLADMFPSKYMSKRVENIENTRERAVESICKDLNIETTTTSTREKEKNESKPSKNSENKKGKGAASTEKNTKNKTSDKTGDKGEKNKYNTRSKSKKHESPPMPPADGEDTESDNKTWRTDESGSGSVSSTSTSTNCSDDSGDEQYEPGFNEFAKDQLKNGKFNIVINLVDDKRRHTDSDSENDSEYDEEDDSEYDDEDEDYDSDDESDSENDRDSDLDYEPSETSEEVGVYDPKHKHGHHGGHGKNKSKSSRECERTEKSKKRNESGGSGGSGGSGESLETILQIKQQMEDILKVSKNDSIARETLQSMIRKEKEFKEREEQKLRSHKKKHVKNFKKLLCQKNSTNDLKYFKQHLSMDEQTAVLSELQCLNKLTITDKPYRLALLQSNIPQEFKAIALKKITNLRRMEPGAGEYYKIKNWVDTFMQIPFGKISNLPLTISDGIEKCHEFMEDAKSKLDGAVYGLNDAKMQIMQMLGQWISNPSAMGTAIAINGPMGTGKCHTFDTPILMHDGSIKMVQDIVVGDKVMGDDSKSRNVLSLGRGEDELYDIVHSNGEKYGVNSEHIMCLKQSGMNIIKNVKTKSGETKYKVIYFDKNDYKQHSKRFSDQTEAERYLHDMKLEHDYIEIPVKSLLTLPKYIRVNLKGYKRGVEFSSKNVPFDPYIIGASLEEKLPSNNKHIPDIYKINDRQTRLELLAGIIDTDGSYCDNSKGYDIIQKNKVLADDILFVARSLGFSANMSQCEKSCMYKGEKRTGTYYRMHLSGDNLSSIPVKCPRKMAKNERMINKDSMVMGITIEPRGWGKYYGFELDKNHKYLLGDFTITHNTSLVKEGISKILNREFAFIPLGGATDSSYLEGHSYTYEGSTWGKIVDILIRSKSMNPVIYFDELDKISETPKGEEIIGILTHLTDTSQNSQFHDKYFAEIDFDLSKCLFIFSYNDPLKVNPILMDRMYKIKTSSYSVKEKIVIANQYLIPKIRYEVNFKEGDIIIPDATLNYIIENYTDKECGVRNLKRCIEIIYKKLNLYRLVKPGTTLFDKENTLVVEFPFHVTTDVVNNLIKKDDNGMNKSVINMYL
jgi:hypothetical protein